MSGIDFDDDDEEESLFDDWDDLSEEIEKLFEQFEECDKDDCANCDQDCHLNPNYDYEKDLNEDEEECNICHRMKDKGRKCWFCGC